MSTGWIWSLITGLATQIPLYLVYIAAAVIGVVRWKQHPKVSRLVVPASLFLMVLQFGVTLTYSTMNLWITDMSIEVIGWIYTIVGASSAFAGALGHGVLIAAVFVDREPVKS